MHQTHNTLPEAVRMQSVPALNRHLAAAIDLHGQLKHAHWNVRGPGFIAVHELFDTVASGALVPAVPGRTGTKHGPASFPSAGRRSDRDPPFRGARHERSADLSCHRRNRCGP